MDTQLFKDRNFMLGLLAVLFHFMFHTAYLLMVVVYLQNGPGVSALDCGLYFVPHALLFMASALLAGKLLVTYGKFVLLAGLLIIFISFVLQIALFSTEKDPFLHMALIGLYGLGNGMVLPFLLNIVLDSIPTRYAGVSAGIFSTFQQIASALGISIIGGVFYSSVYQETTAAYTSALDYGLIAGIVCMALVAGMLSLLPGGAGSKVSSRAMALD